MFRVGQKVRIKQASPNNYSGQYGVGKEVTVFEAGFQNAPYGTCYWVVADYKPGVNHQKNYWFPEGSIEAISRKDQAAHYQAMGEDLVKQGEAFLKKAELLGKYESDEQELAATLVAIMTAKGTEEEKIAKITKILDNRTETNKL